MSTSGTDTFTLTVNEIIARMFAKLGVGSEGEALTDRMYSDGKVTLNLLAKTLSAQEHLWLRRLTSVTMVAGQADYALPSKAMRILSARRKTTLGGNEVPMTPWARQQYLDQPNKTSSPSTPVNFYYDPQRTTGTLYLWPAPSTAVAPTITVELDGLYRLQDLVSSNDEFDAPDEWLETIIYMGAVRLMPEYPVNDPNLSGLIISTAAGLETKLKGWDNEPVSLYLQPDYQGCDGYGYGGYR